MKTKPTCILAVVMTFWCLSTPGGGLRAEASGFEVCEAAITRKPGDGESWLCFYETGRREGREAEAASRLTTLARRHRTTGWPIFNLGLLHWNDP
ncbi:MAG TPA: hypothetical protein VJG13_13290, partial [Thermoanaerobaculia bacterium]|nr:hypothetical protein [Thermoanaerobaculia bacterium]